jgi:Replication-relaxation
VYFLKRKGFEYLQLESEGTADLGAFQEVNPELSWSPQMSHRIALLDLFLALERAVRARPSLVLVRTFLEYRRLPGTSTRETADYVAPEETADNRIVPDGAFVLENLASGRRGLFFVEMDRGTERIAVSRGSRDPRATITGKFLQYDRHLTSGRFAQSYASFGQFGFAIVLLVTVGAERIENIRQASADLPERLHPYYRLGRFPEVLRDFLGPVWKSRSAADPAAYALVADAS